MKLTAQEFGRMVDGACITATMSFSSQVDLAEAAKKYDLSRYMVLHLTMIICLKN